MTPLQWLITQLTPVIQANNPQASAAAVASYATSFSSLYLTYILPNLKVDLTTGVVSFIVPS